MAEASRLSRAGAEAVRPFTIAPLQKTQRYLKVMIYGAFGVGKTYFAGTSQDVPEMRDVLYVDVEGGTMTIQERTDLDVVRVADHRQMARLHEFLRLHCRLRDTGDEESLARLEAQFYAGSTRAPRRYRTVVIDSLSEMHKNIMYFLTGNRDLPMDVPPSAPQFQEWGKASEMLQRFVRDYRDLPMHVIFVVSERELQDERQQRFFRPNLPGQLSNMVQGFLDVVGYLQSVSAGQDTRRRLYLHPGRSFQAKSRFASGVTHLEDPVMADLLAASQGLYQPPPTEGAARERIDS